MQFFFVGTQLWWTCDSKNLKISYCNCSNKEYKVATSNNKMSNNYSYFEVNLADRS